MMVEGLEVVTELCRNLWRPEEQCRANTFSCGESCELLQPHLHGAATSLAASDDQNGIVTSDGADDLAPAGAVERQAQRLRAARRRFQDEQRADAFGRNEHGGKQLLQMLPDASAGSAFRTGRVMRAAIRRGDLCESELANIARQGRLRHAVAFSFETLAQLLLAAYRLASNDSQDGRVALRFHGAEI